MPSVRFPVEAGHILMFARAIDDPNPRFGNEAAADWATDMVAPPTFAMASAQFDPDYVLRPKHGEPWFGSGREATSTPGAAVANESPRLHAEQHFTYHKPIRPGMVLTAESRPGANWEKQSRSGARLLFTEIISEYRDEGGELAVTTRMVGVQSIPADDARERL